MALAQVGGNKVAELLKNKEQITSAEDSLLLEKLWESNEDLFKSVLYNEVLPIFQEVSKRNLLLSVFKAPRDTTRYQIDFDQGNYTKSGLISEIIRRYVNKRPDPVKVSELQKTFPYNLRGKSDSLGNMIVLDQTRYNNEVKDNKAQNWRWFPIGINDKIIDETGQPTEAYLTNQWGMSDKWSKIYTSMAESAGVVVTEM